MNDEKKAKVEMNIREDNIRELLETLIANGQSDIKQILETKNHLDKYEYKAWIKESIAFRMGAISEIQWIQVFKDGNVNIETKLGEIVLIITMSNKEKIDKAINLLNRVET